MATEMDQLTTGHTWQRLIEGLYGKERHGEIESIVANLLSKHRTPASSTSRWDESDIWVITYPDQFREPGNAPLATLLRFANDNLAGWFNGIHILPFFPSSSDEGFSVMDYLEVDSRFGSWRDIEALADEWRLMVDAVINHASARGTWFRGWLADDPEFADFFRTANRMADVSTAVRAREHPLLTRFETSRDERLVWTTFSADQADLDYRNPRVLVRILEVLLDYCALGAKVLRLDAACFLRSSIAEAYPDVLIITETNIPHAENIAYFGTERVPEAHAVYQFSLPPLVVHAFTTGDESVLGGWLSDLNPPPQGATFLNFLASHDGVGLRPLEGMVTSDCVDHLVAEASANGALVNRRIDQTGRSAPYEINSTWYDLIRGPTTGDDAMARFLGSHALMLALQGIPAVYVHSLFASPNDTEGALSSAQARSINRHRFKDLENLETQLEDETSRQARALNGLRTLVERRASSRAFDPNSSQTILDTPRGVIGIGRMSAEGEIARVYVNVTGEPVVVDDSKADSAEGIRQRGQDDEISIGPWGSSWVVLR